MFMVMMTTMTMMGETMMVGDSAITHSSSLLLTCASRSDDMIPISLVLASEKEKRMTREGGGTDKRL